MAIPAARTIFKKKDGILTLTSDFQNVTWTPNSNGPPTVSLTIANITSKPSLTLFAHNLSDPASQTSSRLQKQLPR